MVVHAFSENFFLARGGGRTFAVRRRKNGDGGKSHMNMSVEPVREPMAKTNGGCNLGASEKYCAPTF